MAGSKWAKSQDRIQLFNPSKNATNSELPQKTNDRVKMGQESICGKSQNGPRIKNNYCCLPPERVELRVNSKRKTNDRVKVDQE